MTDIKRANLVIESMEYQLKTKGYIEILRADNARFIIQAVKEKAVLNNEPLTLEELREMGGEPVWLHTFSSKSKNTYISEWALIAGITETIVFFVRVGVAGRKEKWIMDYGKTWVAYRHKPAKE